MGGVEMKGYIYTMYEGADPGHGWVMNDPIFGDVPTLGACVPHIRRAVHVGDYIFVVSGRVSNERQFVVGGFKVAEKIDALKAFRRFPENRLHLDENGNLLGNVIVDNRGKHHPLDEHDNFENRIENYIVGADPLVLETPTQQRAARRETIDFLTKLFGKGGPRVYDVIGRHRKLDEQQVSQMLVWLKDLGQ
jgi:hypothetical protein